MIDDQIVLSVERLRDELLEFRKDLRARYGEPARQVTADDLRERAAKIAETWMVEVAVREDIRHCASNDYLAELNVQFQRLLSSSEHATFRKRYDAAIAAILKRFTMGLVIPLKQARHEGAASSRGNRGILSEHHEIAGGSANSAHEFLPTAFVGYSFAPNDKRIAECVIQTLSAVGVSVATGERPKANRISEKVKGLIDAQHFFVGVFTRRDKIARKKEWTTTAWVVDEKAYAVGKGKRLILVKEEGVGTIGGIQGDYEFIEFSRERLEDLPAKLLQVFDLRTAGFKA